MTLSREQTAAKNWLVASRLMADMVRAGAPDTEAAYTTFCDAVNAYGQQELFARRAERIDAIQATKRLAAARDRSISERFRSRGDIGIGYALDELAALLESGVSDSLNATDEHAGRLDEFSEDLLFQFSELEIKPKDVTRLGEVLRDVIGEARDGGEKQLISAMQQRLETLRDLRAQPDRGAVDNIPVWKVVAIAIAIGFAVWLVVRCIKALRNKKPCHFGVTGDQAIVITFMALLASFC